MLIRNNPSRFISYNKKSRVIILLMLIFFSSCKKYLDEKSNKSLVIPSTIQDLQSLLDYSTRVNQFGPSAAEKSADDFYNSYNDWASNNVEADRRMYIWEPDNLFRPNVNDWSYLYDNVYRSNIVLNMVGKIDRTDFNHLDWDNVKGSALFLRGSCFLKATFIWALAYDPVSSVNDLGIPLRLDPDFNKVSIRSTVQESYDQVIKDLNEAVYLLPVTPIHFIRPSRPAAFALLARTHLAMRQYNKAMLYADSSLQLYNELVDFNTVNLNATFPFARFNPEVLYDSYMNTPLMIVYTHAKIDSLLYDFYELNDLRKRGFFRNNNNGTYGFKGNYSGAANIFDGITTGEMYLIKAECLARSGKTAAAMNTLNELLIKRWETGTFIPFTAIDANDALQQILRERRKELLMRGLRWMDIKRLNKESANIVLKRVLNGQTYTLLPNDLRYALPIPEQVIDITGMPQNPR